MQENRNLLQVGIMLKSWCAFLGPSWAHARSVGLILNLTTGLASHQYHLKFDDKFETSKHFPTNSLWQSKCHFAKTIATTSIGSPEALPPARTSQDEPSRAYERADTTKHSAPLPPLAQTLLLAPLGHTSNGDQPNTPDESPKNDIHLTDSQPTPTNEQQPGLQSSQHICMPSSTFLESL